MSKKQDTIENVVVCQGAVISNRLFEKQENRLLTLLLKGFIVYLLAMGSIGFYLSSFNIGYNALLCHIVILGMSMFCAMLYYRLLVENLGYFLLLIVFAGLVFLFGDYINSGFYAIVNITVDNAAQYFDVDVQRMYNERIGNRYVTVTFVALFIGIVLDILLNVYVSRRMQYMTAIFIIMSLNLIPLYLVMEPDLLYVIMMLAGISMAVVFRAGKHYSPQVSIKRDSRVFKVKGKKKREIEYVYDVKAMLQAGVWSIGVALIVATAVSTVKPKENFNVGYQGNKYKEISMAAASTLLVDGWSGFYRKQANVGGLDSGKLGDVSTVYLDHQTDLLVKMAPYSTDRVYLKNFVGVQYNPYGNNWTNIENVKAYDGLVATQEADAMKNAYEEGGTDTAEAVMEIRNVGVQKELIFYPYYTQDIRFDKGNYYMTYYPKMKGNTTKITPEDYDYQPYIDEDLYVPEENREAVQRFIMELGYLGSQDEIVEKVKQYYQDNMPYTVRPGKTPRRADFVNYFLDENKKGYCAHYASAAVLIFRYLGIPARYVEGYAIDYGQILDGELEENIKYQDFYKGYSELGETAVVQINVTDADAHAWVEIYDKEKGWYPVEVTPSSSEEEDTTAFWDEFADFMNDGDEDAAEITDGQANFVISDRLMRNVVYVILGVLIGACGIVLLWNGGKKLSFVLQVSRADINDKLIMKYSLVTKRWRRKNKEFANQINYRQQIEWLVGHVILVNPNAQRERVEELQEKMIGILEQAGFSNQNISEEEYQFVLKYMKFDNHNEWI